jgi:hypothetical protein
MKPLIDKPLHPLLFAAYPSLALLAWNLGEIQPIEGLRAGALVAVVRRHLVVPEPHPSQFPEGRLSRQPGSRSVLLL